MQEIPENQLSARRRDDFLNFNHVKNAPAAPGIEP
jgi:hypothetical protein